MSYYHDPFAFSLEPSMFIHACIALGGDFQWTYLGSERTLGKPQKKFLHSLPGY